MRLYNKQWVLEFLKSHLHSFKHALYTHQAKEERLYTLQYWQDAGFSK